ncbi:MAG: tetratricopeptide repeat protein, partial [Myxococcales bacterium]|nr:tetratricopeptide repeat protein [Myxococcales bacterium]
PSRCHELHRARPAAPRGRAALGRSARAWGNDCVARLRIGHWASAEASCLEGLTIATEAKTKGALLYNLGRIAEAQGAQAQALEHYRSSLAARPDDRTVKRRLAKLERAVARAAADPRTP